MANTNSLQYWYSNGCTQDIKCTEWLQEILLKKNELTQQRKLKDNLSTTASSFSFQIDGINSLSSCDKQSKDLHEISRLGLTKLHDNQREALQCVSTTSWNCVSEVSEVKYASHLETPKKFEDFTLQQSTEYKTKMSLITAANENVEENLKSIENPSLAECDQELTNVIDLPVSRGENTTVPVLQLKSLILHGNTKLNDQYVSRPDDVEEENSKSGSMIAQNSTPNVSKFENILSREMSPKYKKKLTAVKRFIYPDEIQDKRMSFNMPAQMKSFPCLNPVISQSFTSLTNSNTELMNIPGQVIDKNGIPPEKVMQSPHLSLKETDKWDVKQLPTSPAERYQGFKTALGKKITVSDASLNRVKKLWDECDSKNLELPNGSDNSSKQGNICGGALNASGNALLADSHSLAVKNNIKGGNLKGFKKVFPSKQVPQSSCHQINKTFEGFRTAGEKAININPQSLLKARHLLDDNERKEAEICNQVASSALESVTVTKRAFRSKSPILNSQLCHKVHQASKTNTNVDMPHNQHEMATDMCEGIITNIKLPFKQTNRSHDRPKPTTETQDIINITEDFLLFSSCSTGKQREKRQGEEDNLLLVKKPKICHENSNLEHS